MLKSRCVAAQTSPLDRRERRSKFERKPPKKSVEVPRGSMARSPPNPPDSDLYPFAIDKGRSPEGGRTKTGGPMLRSADLRVRWRNIPSISLIWGPMLDFFERATCQPPTRVKWAQGMPRAGALCGAISGNGAAWLRKNAKKKSDSIRRFLNTCRCVLNRKFRNF